jgi:hypothetical protein
MSQRPAFSYGPGEPREVAPLVDPNNKAYIAQLEARVKELGEQLEFDRTAVAASMTAANKAVDERHWLTEGRGPYEWDDDRWHGEFYAAALEIKAALEPLTKIAANWAGCPKKPEEIAAARVDLREEIVGFQAEIARLKEREKHLVAACNLELANKRSAERSMRMWCHVATLILEDEKDRETIESYLARQWDWSRRTFGDEYRTEQILGHIRKELDEIAANPEDRIEWLDVALLALDGYQRPAGGTVETLMPDLLRKQKINFGRKWVQAGPGEPVEHER